MANNKYDCESESVLWSAAGPLHLSYEDLLKGKIVDHKAF